MNDLSVSEEVTEGLRDMQIIDYKDAKAAGLVRYYTGKPCRHGHDCDRYVSTQTCSMCSAKYAKKWKIENPDKVEARNYRSRDMINESSRKWVAKNREKRRNTHLKHEYGICLKDYEEMLSRQAGLCAICNGNKRLNVDHNHVTNKVRGLLCNSCNLAIGYMCDSVDSLQSAIKYLVAHSVGDLS
jgi:hypothetical protein